MRRAFGGITPQLLAIVRIGLLLSPQAADWFKVRAHDGEISNYTERVKSVPSEERRAIPKAGYAYNEKLEPSSFMDPYISQNEDEAVRTEVDQSYGRLPSISGTAGIDP